jgi:hypothetical protein
VEKKSVRVVISHPKIITGLAFFEGTSQHKFVLMATLRAVYEVIEQVEQEKTIKSICLVIPSRLPVEDQRKPIRVFLSHPLIVSALYSQSKENQRHFITKAIITAIDEYHEHIKTVYEYLNKIVQKDFTRNTMAKPFSKQVQSIHHGASVKITNLVDQDRNKVSKAKDSPTIKSNELIAREKPAEDSMSHVMGFFSSFMEGIK